MKHLSRRDFIHAGCAVAAVTLAPSPYDVAEARTLRGGVGASAPNNNRVSVNVPSAGWMNLAKTAIFSFPAGTALSNDGYPINALSVSTSFSMLPNFYGQYVWKWSNSGTMQFIGQPAIIYSGGAAVASLTSGGGPAGTGYATGNFSVTTAVASPRVVFKFGTLVSAVSGGNGSLVTITHPSVQSGAGFSTGTSLSLGVGCSSNLINGPNADGSWTVTNVSATQCTLNGSTGVISPTVTGSGGVGTQTEAVKAVSGCSLAYLLSGTYSNFGGLVICTAANETDINYGLIYDAAFISQMQQLKGTPGGAGRGGDFWLRFMDLTGVQGSFECDFSLRLTPTSQCWTSVSNLVNAYGAGAMTNGGVSGSFTDLYSCASNPTNSPASGPPIDCEVIQGAPSATNSGGSPGLTVAGRAGFGNWPIIDSLIEPIIFNATAPASTGLTLAFTFSATWLNGGTPYTGFTYTTIAGDTTLSTFQQHLAAALAADTVLKAGKIVFLRNGIAGYVFCQPPTPLSGALTITYTSGPAIMTICNLLPSSIGTSAARTFVFNALLGAFIYTSTQFVQAVPCEAIVELCNRVGANCWDNWPIYTKGAYITARTNFFASPTTGLTSGLKYGGELGNEMWNFGAAPWGRAQCYGIALGCFSGTYGGNAGNYSWQGLRTIQYGNLSIAAWAANSRAANQHYIFTQTQVDDTSVSGNFDLSVLQGQFLVTSNPNYANYAGLGATAQSTSYNTVGNRPVDITTAIGMAPYWGSFWMGGTSSGGPNDMNGTVAQNAAMLQASIDFANGLTSTAFTSLTTQFNGTTTKSGGSTGAYNLGVSYFNRFVLQEALAAQYDSQRVGAGKAVLGIIHYEGGPQWALAQNLANGINTVNSTAATITADTTDLNALVARMTALGWTTGQLIPYTISGLGTLSEVAANIMQMTQGWKYDTDLNGAAANTSSYKNFIKTYYYQALAGVSGANRETKGCQYGYTQSQWGLMYSAWNATAAPPYQNFNALAEYNT